MDNAQTLSPFHFPKQAGHVLRVLEVLRPRDLETLADFSGMDQIQTAEALVALRRAGLLDFVVERGKLSVFLPAASIEVGELQ